MSRVCALVDELVVLVGSEWATTIDQPFIIMGCMERMVIFDLHFHMEAGDDELVVMRDDIIGRCLQWEGVVRAVALAKREDERNSGLLSLSWEKELAPKDEDAVPTSPKSTVGDRDSG